MEELEKGMRVRPVRGPLGGYRSLGEVRTSTRMSNTTVGPNDTGTVVERWGEGTADELAEWWIVRFDDPDSGRTGFTYLYVPVHPEHVEEVS